MHTPDTDRSLMMRALALILDHKAGNGVTPEDLVRISLVLVERANQIEDESSGDSHA